MKAAAIGGSASALSVPVVWDFLGYHFQAGPLVVTVCGALMTRLIVSLKAGGKKRWLLDGLVTGLSVLVSALWVQANNLSLLPAVVSGIGFGALGVGIISVAKGQMGAAFKAAVQTFLRGVATPESLPSEGRVKPPVAGALRKSYPADGTLPADLERLAGQLPTEDDPRAG